MDLNEQQVLAVDSNADKILVVAVPGSGKTATLVSRIERLCKNCVDPRRIIAITFTNAAARELKKRLPDLKLGFTGTCHSWCMTLLRRYGQVIGYRSDKILIQDEDGADEVMTAVIQDLNRKGSADVMFQKIRENRMDRNDKIVFKEYLFRLRSNNTVDYDLILSEALALMEHREVTDAIHDKYSFLFVDEMQDTAIVEGKLYERVPLKKFYVADPDQNIFSWRGTTVQNVLAVSKQADTTVIRLETNYRCGPNICRAANRLISHNTERIATENVPADTSSLAASEDSVTVLECATGGDELDKISRQVSEWLLAWKPELIAVLCRTNELVSNVRDRLVADGHAVRLNTSESSNEIRTHALPYIQMLADTSNDLHARRIINRMGHDGMIADALTYSNSQDVSLLYAYFAMHGKALPHVDVMDVPEILARYFNVSAYTCSAVNKCVEDYISGMEISDAEDCVQPSIPDFVSYLFQQDHIEQLDAPKGISVSTVHGAKGLEWRGVIIAGCEREWWERDMADKEVEAERRLFYVGMTRTMEELVMTWAHTRDLKWKRGSKRIASRFISEAVDEIYQDDRPSVNPPRIADTMRAIEDAIYASVGIPESIPLQGGAV